VRKKTVKKTEVERFVELHDYIKDALPHLYGFLTDEDDFVGLSIKRKADGTFLSLAKGFDSDGGPVVCFGTGYGAIGCLFGIDSTIQAGNWRKDKPWNGGAG
jgi:hypothetical protein